MSTNNETNRNSVDPMDARLQTPNQQAMKSIVGGLPNDTLSMAWRSSLNERLVSEALAKKKRQRISWYLRPALGLGFAGALAVLALFHSVAAPVPSVSPASRDGGIEAEMVSAHRQSTFAFDVGGVGLNPADAVNDPGAVIPKTSGGWSEDDAESL